MLTFQQFLICAYDDYITRPKTERLVFIQRDRTMFWSIIIRPRFDLANIEPKTRFAGESTAEVGGTLLEFSTLCMQRFFVF